MLQGGDLLDWTTRDGGIQEAAFLQRIEALSTMVSHVDCRWLVGVNALAQPAPQHGCSASSFLHIVSRVSQPNPLQIKPCPSSSRLGILLSSLRMPVPHVKRRPHRRACVCLQGYSVLLSNYRRYFSLAGYLSTFTRESIVIAMGIPSLAVSCRAVCEGCMLSSVCIILHLHLWGSLRRLALPGMFPLIPASGLVPCVAGKAGSELCGSCSVTPSSVF